MIVTPGIERYLTELTPLEHPLLQEMEEFAVQERVPIISRPSIRLICSLLRLKGSVEHILEVGTAIGYSAIWLAEAVPQAKVDTIERDSLRVQQAEAYLQRANLTERITVHEADARKYADNLEAVYDCIFIDAAKGQYQLFFEAYAPLLKKGGVIITDNVFFHGYVTEDQLAPKRLQPMVQKIKKYNEWLLAHPHFETTFISIGDGLALSIGRGEQR